MLSVHILYIVYALDDVNVITKCNFTFTTSFKLSALK